MSEHESQITVIGPDTQIKGEMTFEHTARILGRFDGKVFSGGELQIGSTAECTAALEAETVIVDGHVEGNVMARDRIQLNSTACVNGDVVAEKLIVAEGASFNGRCCVGPEAVAEMRAKAATEAKPAPKAPTPISAPTTPTAAGEPPVPELKSNRTDTSAFDWVGKTNSETGEKVANGWGPRPTAADGAA